MAFKLNISQPPQNLFSSTNQVMAPLSDIPLTSNNQIVAPIGINQVAAPSNETPILFQPTLNLYQPTIINQTAPINQVAAPLNETPLVPVLTSLVAPSPELPIPSIVNGLANPQPTTVNISKKFYGQKAALEELDEEFTEFGLKKYTAKDFFNLFDKFFYNIKREILSSMLGKSGNYINGYVNPRNVEIENLVREIEEIKIQIDSVEKEHPYLKNGKVIAQSSYKDNITAAVNEGKIYYMQTAVRRQILNVDVYRGMKNRLGKSTADDSNQIADKDFIIFIDDLIPIKEGPPIINFSDIYTPPEGSQTDNITLFLNRYPITDYTGDQGTGTQITKR